MIRDPFIEKKEFKLDRKLIYTTLASLLILAFITYSIFNYIIIKQDTQVVNQLRSIAEDPKTLDKVAAIRAKEAEVIDFRDSVNKITRLDNTIESRDIVKESLLREITAKMPEDVFLNSLNIRNDVIDIVGTGPDKWTIAEFQKGLEDLDIHDDIFVSNISQEGLRYNFSINMQLRGEDFNGES